MKRLRAAWSWLVLVGLAGVALPAASFQEAAPKPPEPAFPKLFPQPTRTNGYEELVQAGDLVRRAEFAARLGQSDVSLAEKRRILAQRDARQALQLVRQGLGKPVFSPRQQLTFSTILPEFAGFRQLSRLLALEQYVLLADGRNTEAIENARVSMLLAHVVQTDTLISGLVGIAMSTIGLRLLGDHLDQLSARDCERLYQVCREWLELPDRQAVVLEAERRWVGSGLQELKEAYLKEGPAGAARILGLVEPDEDLGDLSGLPRDAEQLDLLMGQALQRLDQHFQRMFEELRRPAWERQFPEKLEGDDLPSRIANMLAPTYTRVNERYVAELAYVRLLATHCVIRRYRWEHDRLPATLEELKLGELALDPFTGLPFEYRPQGRRYSLTSVGAPIDPDNPRAVNGRLPISLTPDD